MHYTISFDAGLWHVFTGDGVSVFSSTQKALCKAWLDANKPEAKELPQMYVKTERYGFVECRFGLASMFEHQTQGRTLYVLESGKFIPVKLTASYEVDITKA